MTYLFIFLTVSSKEQKFLILIKPNLPGFFLSMIFASCVPPKSFLSQSHKVFFLYVLLEVL